MYRKIFREKAQQFIKQTNNWISNKTFNRHIKTKIILLMNLI